MKRFACLSLTVLLLFSLAACGSITIQVDFGDKDATEDTVQTEDTAIPTPTQTHTEDTAPSVEEETGMSAQQLWEELYGCWVGEEERFAYFTYDGDALTFWSGLWEVPIPQGREAATAEAPVYLGQGRYQLTLTYPPMGSGTADGQDTEPLLCTLSVDLSELEQGVLRIEAPQDSWRSYTWGGFSYDDAYDASHNVQYADFDQMQLWWNSLTGYWNCEDGSYLCFDQMDSHTLILEAGDWASQGGELAYFEKAMSPADSIPMKLVLAPSDVTRTNMVVSVDTTDRETGTLTVQLGEQEVWKRYTYAGTSVQEARP